MHRNLVLQHLDQLGLRFNIEKSKLCSVQRISYLGMELGSIYMVAYLSADIYPYQAGAILSEYS